MINRLWWILYLILQKSCKGLLFPFIYDEIGYRNLRNFPKATPEPERQAGSCDIKVRHLSPPGELLQGFQLVQPVSWLLRIPIFWWERGKNTSRIFGKHEHMELCWNYGNGRHSRENVWEGNSWVKPTFKEKAMGDWEGMYRTERETEYAVAKDTWGRIFKDRVLNRT